MIFVEAGTKYVYVFMFLCSVVLPPFTVFLFYRSGIGRRLPANATQAHYTLGMVISFCSTKPTMWHIYHPILRTLLLLVFTCKDSLEDESTNKSQQIRL